MCKHLIPFRTPEEIRKGVYERMKVFYRKEGGVVYAAGNAITADTPVENIKAYAETLRKPIS